MNYPHDKEDQTDFIDFFTSHKIIFKNMQISWNNNTGAHFSIFQTLQENKNIKIQKKKN